MMPGGVSLLGGQVRTTKILGVSYFSCILRRSRISVVSWSFWPFLCVQQYPLY